MKRVTAMDDAAGHSVGWNPDGATTFFPISDLDASGGNSAFISVEVSDNVNTNYFCDAIDQSVGSFRIKCSSGPVEGSELHYLIANLPAHVLQ